jgi:hypothetical protein
MNHFRDGGLVDAFAEGHCEESGCNPLPLAPCLSFLRFAGFCARILAGFTGALSSSLTS